MSWGYYCKIVVSISTYSDDILSTVGNVRPSVTGEALEAEIYGRSRAKVIASVFVIRSTVQYMFDGLGIATRVSSQK